MARGIRAGMVVAMAVGLVIPSMAGPVASQTPQPVSGGRVVVGAEQEPFGLNHWMACCTLSWTEMMVDNLLPDAYALTPDHQYVPEVIEGEAVVTEDPFTVTYTIRQEARWNDGMPVSTEDFAFTHRAHVRPRNSVASREGYDHIRSTEVIDPKTIRFEFRRPYPDYKELFRDILPKHILAGKRLNRAWHRSIPISAGPFEFGELVKGSHLTLVRNDDYWGEHPAYLDEIEFRFIAKVPDQIDALASGEVDVIYPSLHPALAAVHSEPEVDVQSSPSLLWEHVDFQFRDDRLVKPYVRRAIATAIDRAAIVDEILRPIDPDAQVLNNLLYGIEQPEYESHFQNYQGDPAAARAILEDHGCVENDEGIYRCGGHQLTLVYYTTAPNPIRRHLATMIRNQLDAAGIEIEVRRRDPSVVFGRILLGGRFDLFNFAWVMTTISGENPIWRCGGSQNFTDYCNEDVDALLTEAVRETDPARQARLANLADEVMARDLPSLPLYQRPTFLAYSSRVEGLIDNPTREGFTWNIGDWYLQP